VACVTSVQKYNKTLSNYPEIIKTTYMTVRQWRNATYQITANIWLLGFRGFLRTPRTPVVTGLKLIRIFPRGSPPARALK